MRLNNTYFLLRHGEALSNTKNSISCWPEKKRCPLTLKGRKQVGVSAKKLKNKEIDLIFASDLLRTRQTAEIVVKEIGIKPVHDKRLREYNVGTFNGKLIKELDNYYKKREDKFKIRTPEGENYSDIRKRVWSFLKEIDKKYSNKNILIVSHQLPLTLLDQKVRGVGDKEYFSEKEKKKRMGTGELMEIIF